MHLQQRMRHNILPIISKRYTIAQYLRQIGLDAKVQRLIDHMESQIFKGQPNVQEFHCVKEVLVFGFLLADAVQRVKLVL